MRSPMMLEFPVDEYEARLGKFVVQMEKYNLDAVILTTKENTRYFSGFQMIVWDSKISKPGALVITRDGTMTLVGSSGGLGTMTITTCVDDIRPWDRLGRNGMSTSFPDAIFDVLVSKGCHKGRVGMELGVGFRMHLTYSDSQSLFEHLQHATIVDAAPAVWALRSVKSAREIDRMRTVCDINIKAYDKAMHAIFPGMTEMDLFRKITTAMLEFGADDIFPLGIRAGVDRYDQGNCPPSDRPIGRGEVILIDGGPGYRGYFSDIIREAIIGEPTPRQKELYAVSVEANEVGLAAIRPGVRAREVCESIDGFIAARGYDALNASRGWSGHSIGLDIHEPPMFERGSDLVLEPGMVFAVEPALYEPGVGMFNIEENIVVTETGHEVLTPLSRELLVL